MTSTVHEFLHADSGTLPYLPDESVHLIVTSPPYPMIAMWDEQFAGRSQAAGDALAAEDGTAAFEAMHRELDRTWEECARLLVPGGIIAVNVGDAVRTIGNTFRLYSNHSRIITSLTSLGLQPLPLVIWNKPTNAPNKFMGSGMLPGGAYVTLEHEYIIIARKGGPRRPRNEAGRERRRRSAVFWEERNVWFSDMWRLGSARQALLDPADRNRSGAFPLELPYRLIAMYSWQEDLVLDPFAGTGTTALAAMALGRSSLNVELSDDLLGRAVARALDPAVEEVLRQRNQRRLEDHRAFLTTRDAPKHRNRHYGFPVITAQETDLRLPMLAEVTGAGGRRPGDGPAPAGGRRPGDGPAPAGGRSSGDGPAPAGAIRPGDGPAPAGGRSFGDGPAPAGGTAPASVGHLRMTRLEATYEDAPT